MKKMTISAIVALFALMCSSTAWAEMGNGGQRGQRGGSQMLRMADSDGDGKISKEEFLQMAEKRFSRMDSNEDGVLDEEELAAMTSRMGNRRMNQ